MLSDQQIDYQVLHKTCLSLCSPVHPSIQSSAPPLNAIVQEGTDNANP